MFTTVRLSKQELFYLTNRAFVPRELSPAIRAATMLSADLYSIRVSNELVVLVGGALTDRLAEVGFDADYRLTAEGRLLEGLIDRFV